MAVCRLTLLTSVLAVGTMKQIIILTIFIAVAAADTWIGGLRARFTANPAGLGTSGFYDLPRNTSAAINEGWTKTERPSGPLPTLTTMYCANNRYLCGFYDDSDYIAGLQIALDTSLFTGQVYDWKTLGFTSWTPSDDGKTYWTIQVYFVDADYLAESIDTRVASRDSNQVLQLDGVWVTGNNGELLKIPNTVSGIEESDFTKQASIPWMGRHYYYNMSTTTTCDAATLFPWFPLYDDDQLVGTGFVTYGQLPEDSEKDWFERPPKAAVKIIVPEGPECLYDLADSPGLVTMHLYYVDQPWLILTNN